MKSHALLLSTPMVQATLAGRKFCTRRTPGPTNSFVDGKRVSGKAWKEFNFDWTIYSIGKEPFEFFSVFSEFTKRSHVIQPIYKPGHTIWFRETWRKYYPVDENGYTDFNNPVIEFAADNPPMINEYDGDGFLKYNKDGSEKFVSWRPSIHLPKVAARLWAGCISVRCEHLQDITEEQAGREGVDSHSELAPLGIDTLYKNYSPGCDTYEYESSLDSFKTLWGSIHGWDSWHANGPVYAIEFKLLSTTGRPV